MARRRTYKLFCCNCGDLMAKLSQDEYDNLEDGIYHTEMCFDCDRKCDFMLPSVMWPGAVGQVIVIDDTVFWCNQNVNGELRWRSQSHAHERTHARSCLSSSTYLNISSKQDNQDTVFFLDYGPCPECGFWARHFSDGSVICERCDFLGAAMVDTLVGLGVLRDAANETIADNLGVDCPDCNTLRLFGRGQYCAYHHALLTEQNEDGSLGWGNA